MWVKARQDKNGNFNDFEVEQKAGEIVSTKLVILVIYESQVSTKLQVYKKLLHTLLIIFHALLQDKIRKKVSDGELTTSGSSDVLSLALGNPEHHGRVRGVGGQVKPDAYFNLPKRRRKTVQETVRLTVQKILEEETEKIVARERAHWLERIMRLEAKLEGRVDGNISPLPPPISKEVGYSGQGSCSNLGEKEGLKRINKEIGAPISAKKRLELEADEDIIAPISAEKDLELEADKEMEETGPNKLDLKVGHTPIPIVDVDGQVNVISLLLCEIYVGCY